MKPLHVLIADDHSVVVAGIRSLLAESCEVVGVVTDGRALVDAALRLRPDLIILAVSMPLLNGIDAARQIKSRWPEAKLLFFSRHGSPTYLREALQAGACGYVLKSSPAEELRTAIDAVLEGRIYISSAFGWDVLEKLRTPTGKLVRASPRLTQRQRETLQLIAEGRSNKEVAQILHVSAKTVEFHRKRIKDKVGVQTTAQLAVFAVRAGVVG